MTPTLADVQYSLDVEPAADTLLALESVTPGADALPWDECVCPICGEATCTWCSRTP